MEKNQSKTLTNNPTGIVRGIQIAHFILIIVMTLMAGLYAVNLMLNMGGAYKAVDDPCGVCQEITGYRCEKPVENILCLDEDCPKVNISEINLINK